MPEYQDAEVSDYTKIPKYKDGDAGAHPKFPVEVDREDLTTHNKPEYFITIYIYVKNIDRNDKNTWRTIYEAIDAPYFGDVNLFTKVFLDQCKNHPNEPQKIHLK